MRQKRKTIAQGSVGQERCYGNNDVYDEKDGGCTFLNVSVWSETYCLKRRVNEHLVKDTHKNWCIIFKIFPQILFLSSFQVNYAWSSHYKWFGDSTFFLTQHFHTLLPRLITNTLVFKEFCNGKIFTLNKVSDAFETISSLGEKSLGSRNSLFATAFETVIGALYNKIQNFTPLFPSFCTQLGCNSNLKSLLLIFTFVPLSSRLKRATLFF